MGKSKVTKKTVGITGCSGFIGKNLVDLLNRSGRYDTRCFKGDLLKEKDIENFFKKKDIHTVIHLAGAFFGEFNTLLDANFNTTANILKIGIENGLEKIIFSSSGAVYGNPVGNTSKETDCPRPNTYYGLIKLYAEQLIQLYSNLYGLKYIILRFPSVYGEGNDKGVIYNFLSGIREKGLITIYGDGKATRNFLHVSDACGAIKKCIDYKNSDIFNISNPSKVSINDLVKLLKKNYSFKVEYREADNNLHDLSLNINKARKAIGFIPRVKDMQL